MAYFKPYIDESGFHMPTYNEIKEYLINGAKGIYGQDIYLENDSQDYEFISLISAMVHDAYLTNQLVYNNRSPSTAIGNALVGLVKLNGLKPKRATNSTCIVRVSGEPNTEIINGIISDENNINWNLESPVTIPACGYADVLATCQKLGPVYAGIGQLNKITTPTNGWVSTFNYEPVLMGQSVEDQETLRARQTISTAKPSKTVLEGTIGGIAEILDVTRYRVYENDTNIPDKNTVPGHSICAVVEGGKDYNIAHEIYLRKTPGCGTYGDVEVEIETGSVLGQPLITPIRFFRPRYYDLHVTATIKRLPGYVSQITYQITANIVDYLNSLQIGENLTLSALWGAALKAMPNLTMPLFSVISITAGLDENAQNAIDIDVPFNCVTRGDSDNVQILFV